jgi:hypothetical protein
MRTKILAILVPLLVGLTVGYFIGFSRAHTAYLRQQAIYDLHLYPQLYMRFQEGDTNKVAMVLRALIIGPYNSHLGGEIVTNEFTNDLAVAREVYNEEAAASEEWNRTNRGPNTALEPTATAPSVSDKP